jgi:hypothetical protein
MQIHTPGLAFVIAALVAGSVSSAGVPVVEIGDVAASPVRSVLPEQLDLNKAVASTASGANLNGAQVSHRSQMSHSSHRSHSSHSSHFSSSPRPW